MKINGWRRTLAQTLADEARLSEQSRMRAINLNSRGTNLELFGVDVPDHSLLEISHGTLLPWELTHLWHGLA